MIKRQLNPLRIGKGLLCLLALFMMLLTPQGAWAEDYALSIAGKQYTAEQLSALKSAIALTSSDCAGIKSGTVTLTPASGQDPVKLTLNNAELSGDNNIVSSIDLTVDFVGSSSITLPENTTIYVFEGNGTAKLHFTNTGKTTNPLTIMFGSGLMNNWGEGSDVISDSSDPSNDWWLNSNTNTSEERILYWNKKYDLWIGETQVCYFGREDVLDNQKKVSFDVNSITLNLNNVTLESDITTKLDNLTISLADENTLTGSIKYTGDNSNSSLTFNANLEYANNAKITLSTSNQDIGVISGFKTVQVNSPLETTYTNWGNDVKAATIEAQCYKIRVGGVLVTEANKGNVLGTPDGTDPTVSFEPAGDAPATLTLHDATINVNDGEEYGVKYWDNTALNIKLIGTNNINTQYSEPILYDGESDNKPTLTFKSGSIPCSLHLETSGYTSVIKSFDNVLGVNGIDNATGGNLYIISDNQVHYNSTNGLYTGESSDPTSVVSATITSGYGLTIAGILVHDGNKGNVLNDNKSSVSLTPATDTTPATLTLTDATINSGDNYAFVMGDNITALNVVLVGVNTVTGNGFQFATSSALLTFKTNGTDTGSLAIVDAQDKNYSLATTTVEGGSVTPAYENGLEYNATNKTISVQSYGLTVAGRAVTSINKDDVLGDGTVSFTPAQAVQGDNPATPATLTLKGATLTAPVIVGLPNLTIDIQGTNSITTNTTCIQKMADAAPVLTFKSTSNEVGSLTLKNTSEETTGVNNIGADNVGSFSISNELALILLRYGDYTSNSYYFSAGEVHDAQLVPSYGVQVNDMQVYAGNATNVLGDGKVEFDKSTGTLTLKNASGIEAISTTLSTLNIDLVGSNSLYRSSNGSIFESASGEAVIISLKSTGATKGALTMETGENSTATFTGTNVTLKADNSLALLSGNLADNKGTLVYGVNYDLWISGTRVTSANASNIWGEGTDFEFDAKNSVLYYRSGGSTSYPVLSGLPNLTIKIGSPDNEGLYSKNNIGIIKFGAPQGVTITATSGTLTISKILDNTETVQKFDIVGSGDEPSLIQGFSSVTYSDFVPMADGITYNTNTKKLEDGNSNEWKETTTFVTSNGINLSAPAMSGEAIAGADGISLILIAELGTIKYSVDYDDSNETDITNATYDSDKMPVISKPATVTAYATINGHNSTLTKGKYFDSAERPVKLIYDADPIDLVLAPAIDESDGISITGIEANVTYNTSTGKIKSSTMGSFGGPVAMRSTDGKTVILNNFFTMNFKVVPSAPTINLASGTYLSTHDPIEITAPELPEVLGAKTMFKWDNDNAREYEEAIPVQTGTLTAWVVCTPEGQDEPAASDEVTATFTIMNRTLDVSFATGQTWASFYDTTEDFNLPNNLMAYIVTKVEQNSVTVSPINYVPKGVAVLLENNTTMTDVTNTSYEDNKLQGVSEADGKAVSSINGTVYALYNNKMMRVTSGSIPAKKCYLVVGGAVNAGSAPQLNIVFDNEANITGIDEVRSKKAEVGVDLYDLQGRKVQKPSKKGLYIQKGHKVVVNK